MPSLSTSLFCRPYLIFTLSFLLRLLLLAYGRYQDTHSPTVKYTDIDYLVFTDAASFIARGRSPYDRATYRYTPLLAWLLLPTTWGGKWWWEFGKVVFAAADLGAGGLIYLILKRRWNGRERALKFAGIWLVNPMVANISTRGSSEGVLALVVVGVLWAVLERRVGAAGVLLGLGVHLKIYPFVYGVSVFWWLRTREGGGGEGRGKAVGGRGLKGTIAEFFNYERMVLVATSLGTFTVLNVAMFQRYGWPFIEHTFSYHLTRIDHRHNFSVYNTVLHLNSANPDQALGFKIESLAFIPQIFLSVIVIPYLLAEKDLAGSMLAQTFAFVTFNKVCTSQYFLWYMVFLPFYLPQSSLLRKPRLGMLALALWVLGQAAWLQQGYELEFLGKSTFFPGLWLASVTFFVVNCWILGIVVADIRSSDADTPAARSLDQAKKNE